MHTKTAEAMLWSQADCERAAAHDFLACAGRLVQVPYFQGYIGDDSRDIDPGSPVTVRVSRYGLFDDVLRWMDATILDPCWSLELPPQTRALVGADVSSPWFYAPSWKRGTGRERPDDLPPPAPTEREPPASCGTDDIATHPNRLIVWLQMESLAAQHPDDAVAREAWSRFIGRSDEPVRAYGSDRKTGLLLTGHEQVAAGLSQRASPATRSAWADGAEALACDHPDAPTAFRLGLGMDDDASLLAAIDWTAPGASRWQRQVVMRWMRGCAAREPRSERPRHPELITAIAPIICDADDPDGLRTEALNTLAAVSQDPHAA